ncbi:MAG: hypothetical protein ACREDW_00940, partial [Aestuariivirgaceae bacterium]
PEDQPAASSESADDQVIIPPPPPPVSPEPVSLAEASLNTAPTAGDAKPQLAHMLRKGGRRKSKSLK